MYLLLWQLKKERERKQVLKAQAYTCYRISMLRGIHLGRIKPPKYIP